MRDSRLRPPRGTAGQLVNLVLLTDPLRGRPFGGGGGLVFACTPSVASPHVWNVGQNEEKRALRKCS